MEDNQSLLDLQIDQEASHNITESTKWGKFMAVLVITAFGLLFLLFIVLFGRLSELFFQTDIEGASSTSVMIFVIVLFGVVGVIMIILMSFLIRGANRIRKGIQNRDQYLFNSGLSNLKNYFVMYGVLAILGLVFTAINLLKN